MSNYNFSDETIKHNGTSKPKPKPTIRIERIPSTKDINDKLDALQRSEARTTRLLAKLVALEERRRAMREGGWY